MGPAACPALSAPCWAGRPCWARWFRWPGPPRPRLAPLQRLRPAQQDGLAETLLAWFQHGCNANEVALHVHVHPQTVRYRLRQVEDLFGDQLRDPDRRFELEIALRARHMLRRLGS